MNAADIKAAIRAQALAAGFDAVGFAPAQLAPEAKGRLQEFLNAGRHGDMGWMVEKADRRGDPQTLWPAARSVVVLGLNYGPDQDPLSILAARDRAAISVYARHRDYHDVVKKRLKQLGRWIAATYGCEIKVFVDTAPVMEKPLAAQGGIGWQGKHTNLVSRAFGSWLFLGEIYLALDVEPDAAEVDHCGACQRCLDVCPTAAFPAPYQLDARRCISYLTIEHAGPIPLEFRPLMGNRIYGCDDCLSVCPWNKFAQATPHAPLVAREDLTAPRLAALAALDDAAFRALFSGSPVKRIGRDRFLRNVLIAIGNSAAAELLPAIEVLLSDPAPIVRGAAVWALSRLDPGNFAARQILALREEFHPDVRSEWTAGIPISTL
ncbi:tRNA epoxyqueuosine(34) reductase QueG [Dongia rigui]|uniref:Epoxyqueuosine reductase n=1 Tax=Dongia rigui TaxID=940149 RepID=A0ABU5DVV0_9PROT|nr:tRNA epoxyqueuosine(34) reductase QueG [Dongia rigui]MDY0871427.1 tRNA epoxyqueuosine(34) reductase QueG [Dongia rigui]